MTPKYYVLEWFDDPDSGDSDLKVTPHSTPEAACLASTKQRCSNTQGVSTVNPVTGEGEEKR